MTECSCQQSSSKKLRLASHSGVSSKSLVVGETTYILFAINPTSSLFGGVTYLAVMNDMLEDIKEGYLRGAAYAQILSQFSPEPISPSVDVGHLKQHLQKMWAAQEAIKELQSQQLNNLADFMETYPHMLRWAYDPRDDASTIPPEHISTRLRVWAKKVSNTQYVRLRRPVYCMFLLLNRLMISHCSIDCD
jgi:hypothetical protein